MPIFAKAMSLAAVSTMNISLPAQLKKFVDEQVKHGYGTGGMPCALGGPEEKCVLPTATDDETEQAVQ